MESWKRAMAARLPVVTVVGSGSRCEGPARELAAAAGRLAAFAGCDLLTGGGAATMEAVSRAFVEAPHRAGRAIGILPGRIEGLESETDRLEEVRSYAHSGRTPNRWVEFALPTHLPGNDPLSPTSRNYLNILSADLVVALAGGKGTQAEVQIALALGRPVIALLAEGEAIGSWSSSGLPAGVKLARSGEELESFASPLLQDSRVARPTFESLRRVYKVDAGSVHNCTMTFPNTCAIRMSEALAQVVPGILDKFKVSGFNLCKHNFIRGAQDLAAVLRRGDVFGVYDRGFEAPGSAPAQMMGEVGIACYMNIPSYPDGQGHIDLWDRTGPVGSAYWTGNPIWFWRLP